MCCHSACMMLHEMRVNNNQKKWTCSPHQNANQVTACWKVHPLNSILIATPIAALLFLPFMQCTSTALSSFICSPTKASAVASLGCNEAEIHILDISYGKLYPFLQSLHLSHFSSVSEGCCRDICLRLICSPVLPQCIFVTSLCVLRITCDWSSSTKTIKRVEITIYMHGLATMPCILFTFHLYMKRKISFLNRVRVSIRTHSLTVRL